MRPVHDKHMTHDMMHVMALAVATCKLLAVVRGRPVFHGHSNGIHPSASAGIMRMEQGHMLQRPHALRACSCQVAALSCGAHLQHICNVGSAADFIFFPVDEWRKDHLLLE